MISATLLSAPSDIIKVDPDLKNIMHNGITVYGSRDVATQFAKLVNEFSDVFNNSEDTVDMPESD